jgi:uncharacterized repeat protein (TIGR03809 family)
MQQDQDEKRDLGAAWSGTEFARRWLALSERRRDDLIELYRSGRWRRYYSEAQFLSVMRRAKAEVEAWAALAAPAAEPLAKTG